MADGDEIIRSGGVFCDGVTLTTSGPVASAALSAPTALFMLATAWNADGRSQSRLDFVYIDPTETDPSPLGSGVVSDSGDALITPSYTSTDGVLEVSIAQPSDTLTRVAVFPDAGFMVPPATHTQAAAAAELVTSVPLRRSGSDELAAFLALCTSKNGDDFCAQLILVVAHPTRTTDSTVVTSITSVSPLAATWSFAVVSGELQASVDTAIGVQSSIRIVGHKTLMDATTPSGSDGTRTYRSVGHLDEEVFGPLSYAAKMHYGFVGLGACGQPGGADGEPGAQLITLRIKVDSEGTRTRSKTNVASTGFIDPSWLFAFDEGGELSLTMSANPTNSVARMTLFGYGVEFTD